MSLTRCKRACEKEGVRGFIIYEGPSMLDGNPIVAILVPSTNRKTHGGMHLWILMRDIYPRDAIHSGLDSTICGDCKYRRTLVDGVWTRACYVIIPAMSIIYKSYRNGEYQRLVSEVPHYNMNLKALQKVGKGEFLRIAAYGDPAAVPYERLQWTREVVEWGKEGAYTHQWDNPKADPRLKEFCMASVDTLSERDRAKAAGWRTFRVDWQGDGLQPGEMWCLATEEGNSRGHCNTCGLCSGLKLRGAKDQAVVPHGTQAKLFKRLVMNLKVS